LGDNKRWSATAIFWFSLVRKGKMRWGATLCGSTDGDTPSAKLCAHHIDIIAKSNDGAGAPGEIAMLKIYHMPGSRSQRPIWTAEELGLPYESVVLHRPELKLPGFLAINPLGTAPAIEDGDIAMHESCAIVQYLVDRYDTQNRISPAATSAERAPYLQWLHFAEASFWPLTGAFMTASGRFTGAPPDEPAMAAAKEKIANVMNYLDNVLAAHPYIAGDRFTAADIALYWNVMVGKLMRAADDRETKHVQAWGARIQERAAYQKAVAMPEGWVNPPPGAVPTPPVVRLS
jgi:glutathione S-transferase